MLDAIRDGAPISRAEISRRSGISKPTVSLALQSLLEAGLVREAERGPDGPGYGAVYFEEVPEAALVLGLDLGARFVRGAVCDLGGTIRARQDVELASPDAEGATNAIERLRASLLEATALDPALIDGVVAGVPGVIAEDGTLQLVENVAGLQGRHFGDELQAALGLPVTLENDINLAALGEQWQGVARGVADFVFVSVGTGMGSGLVLGGELHRGRHGAAGEIDFALAGVGETVDPSAAQVTQLAQDLAGLAADPPAVFASARAGRRTRSPSSTRSRAGSRSTSRRSRPWRTSSSSSSAAASAPTATCCSTGSHGCLRAGCRSRRGSQSRHSARPPSSPVPLPSGSRPRSRTCSPGALPSRPERLGSRTRLAARISASLSQARPRPRSPSSSARRGRSAPRRATPPPATAKRHVREPRRRVPDLEPHALDQLARGLARLRERQAGAGAERRRQRVDLPHRRFAAHADMAAEKHRADV